MTDRDEQRIQRIHDILEEKNNSSRAFMQYAAHDRDYLDGDTLYMREAHFLMVIGPGPGKPMSEVASALSVTNGAVSQIAGRLEKKGYLIRLRCPDNYRRILAVLTEKGEAFYRKHLEFDRQKYADLDAQYLSRFSDEELDLILRYEQTMTRLFGEANET